jgi:prepilin-type N-terminal cleavage/methylation domain-containing protein
MFKKLFYKEDGFTLVELLVTIAILAVLFGITTLTLGGIGANAQTTVNNAEVAIVQSALDIHMARFNLAAVTAHVSSCLVGTEVIDAVTTLTTSEYLRSKTACAYSWSVDGAVTQTAASCVCP